MFCVRCSVSGARCSVFGVRCWVLGLGSWVLGLGCSVSGVPCPVPEEYGKCPKSRNWLGFPYFPELMCEKRSYLVATQRKMRCHLGVRGPAAQAS